MTRSPDRSNALAKREKNVHTVYCAGEMWPPWLFGLERMPLTGVTSSPMARREGGAVLLLCANPQESLL